MTRLNCPKRSAYPNSQVKMAEPGECESSQDEKMQGTCTEGSVCTNDVTSSDNVKIIDIRTKVSIRMSDVTTSNIVQDKDSSHGCVGTGEEGSLLFDNDDLDGLSWKRAF